MPQTPVTCGPQLYTCFNFHPYECYVSFYRDFSRVLALFPDPISNFTSLSQQTVMSLREAGAVLLVFCVCLDIISVII